MTNQERNANSVRTLRLLADWYEKHPDAPSTYIVEDCVFVSISGSTKEELADAVRTIGSCEKSFKNSEVEFTVKISDDFRIRFYSTRRDLVCRKVVTGTKHVPEYVRTVPEHDEETYEWICDEPILAPTDGESK